MRFPPDPRENRSLFPALAAFAAAAALALVSRGFSGDEEVAHYLMSRHGFTHPTLFLSLAGRPLVTLLFAIPAQAGLLGARLVAAGITGLGAYAVARLAVECRLSPWWSLGFLLAQPFFLAHSGTVMTEPVAAALLAWAVLALVTRRTVLLAVLMALAPLARMEFLVFWPLAIPVIWRGGARRWLLLLPAGLVLWDLGGAVASGDTLWLLHQASWKVYPQRNPLHYAKSYVWITGLVAFAPAFLGLWVTVWDRISRRPATEPGFTDAEAAARTRGRIASAAVVLLLMLIYTVFAAWRPITFGNLRYLAYGGPAFAFLATAGTEDLFRRGRSAAVVSGLAAALAASVLLWGHTLIHDFAIMRKRDLLPPLFVAGWALLVVLPARVRRVVPVLLLVAAAWDLAVRHPGTFPVVPNPEQASVREAAAMLGNPLPGTTPFYNSHALLAFYRGEDFYDRDRFPALNTRVGATAEPGSVLFWDTHYMAHAGSTLEIRAFFGNRDWAYLGGVIASDSSWAGAYFSRVAGDSAALARAASLVTPGMPREKWMAATILIQAGIPVAHADSRADPTNPDPWRRLAQRLALVRRAGEAQAALDRAIQLAPRDPLNFAMQGEVWRMARKFPEALEASLRALALKPGDPLYQESVGQILLEMKRVDEALPYLTAAADKLTKRPDIQLVAGKVLYDQGRYEEAERYFLATLRLIPDQVDAAVLSSISALRRGDRGLCKERLRNFIRAHPREAVPYLVLGDLLMDENKPYDAQALWEDGLKKTGGDPSIASRLQSLTGPPKDPN